MKRFIKTMAATLSATMVLTSGVLMVNADGIAIDSTNFPDENWRKFVASEFDKNSDGALSQSEIDAADFIDAGGQGIADFTGIEYFTAMTAFQSYSNPVKAINLSKNKAVEDLYIEHNPDLQSINVSGLTNLQNMNCNENWSLTSIDVTGCTNLVLLDCGLNRLSSIDLTTNTNLTYIFVRATELTSLDLSKNTKLRYLDCCQTKLTSLDISKNEDLYALYCGLNDIKTVDITHNPSLVTIYNDGIEIKENDEVSIWKLEKEEWIGTVLDYVYVNPGYLEIPKSATLVLPTPTPTVGAIPTVVPTKEPEQSAGSFVDRCYSVALGREADGEGYNYWLESLNGGAACGAQLGYGFIFSGEYTAKNTSDEEFVTDLYSMYFGRPADDAGFNYWIGLLKDGTTREEVFAGFANSTEFDNLCSRYGVVTGKYLVGIPNDQQGGVNCFVARLYKVFLNRLPDQGGQSGWVDKLISGEVSGTTCSFGFVFSPEFIGGNPSNEQFVACMYRAFFGREPDEAGFTAWVQRLIDGASYQDVFDGFAGSAEFANLCASYGITA